MKHFLTAVSIACTGLFYLSMGFAISLSASQVDSVLIKHGYGASNVDYYRVNSETSSVPPKIGSIETPDVVINTKYEAAIALEWKDSQWVNSVLLLKEMQRIYPERTAEFQKNIDSIKKHQGVTDKQIEDAYVAQLKEFCANNQQFTFYVKGTRQISPEVSIMLKYLVASPSDRGKYKQGIINIATDLAIKALRAEKVSLACTKYYEFGDIISHYSDMEDFIMPEIRKIYAQNDL